MLGLSGATIVNLGDVTLKVASPSATVVAQGRWLQENTAPCLPVVHEVFSYGYVMETLHHVSTTTMHRHVLMETTLRGLTKYVWAEPPTGGWDWDEFTESIRMRCAVLGTEEVMHRLLGLTEEVRWMSLRAVRTHGDPTLANVMIADDDIELVIIDPIPPRTNLPQLEALDRGKMLQSAYGFETEMFGWSFVPGLEDIVLDGLSDDESFAARYFAAVHFLRLLPYTPESKYSTMERMLHGALDRI